MLFHSTCCHKVAKAKLDNVMTYIHVTAESPCTISTISSNDHPPLIKMNNNRSMLVNGEHNCSRQKAKRSKSHFAAGASGRRRLGCSERDFTADIHLAPASHFITMAPIKSKAALQQLHFSSPCWFTHVSVGQYIVYEWMYSVCVY